MNFDFSFPLLFQTADHRSGENDVANGTKTNDENSRQQVNFAGKDNQRRRLIENKFKALPK
jgi:hypothetical protein